MTKWVLEPFKKVQGKGRGAPDRQDIPAGSFALLLDQVAGLAPAGAFHFGKGRVGELRADFRQKTFVFA